MRLLVKLSSAALGTATNLVSTTGGVVTFVFAGPPRWSFRFRGGRLWNRNNRFVEFAEIEPRESISHDRFEKNVRIIF